MRLGIFGGTFDPVHYGHLLLAESCREQRRLDRVWFLPAATPPHKQGEGQTRGETRLEMLRLAIGGHPGFDVCTWELDRGGVSYTVETLSSLREQLPDDKLFFLLGADMFLDLPQWREPARVAELATLVVVARPPLLELDCRHLEGVIPPEGIEAIRANMVEMPIAGFSSTEMRQRIAQGRSIRFWTPRAVEQYIQTHGLYGPLTPSPGTPGEGRGEGRGNAE